MKYIYSTIFFLIFLFLITMVIDFNYVQEVENIDMESNDISEIDIDLDETNVSLSTTVDKDIKIEHIYSKQKEPASQLYTYQEGSTLFVNEYPLNNSNLISKKETINIYIPEEYQFDVLNIVSGTGQVNVDSLAVGSLAISSQTGNVDIANVTAEDVSLSGGQFGVNITNLIAKSFDSAVDKVQLTISNSIVDQFDFESSQNSRVNITKLVADEVNILNKQGEIDLVLSDGLDYVINTLSAIGNPKLTTADQGYEYKVNKKKTQTVYNLDESSTVNVTFESTEASKDE